MKLCRYQAGHEPPRVGCLLDDVTVGDLTSAGVASLESVLERDDPLPWLKGVAERAQPARPLSQVRLLPPLEGQEVWAAGVTYLRSKTARMEESKHSASAYDLVYEAERPELFFKALPQKVVGPGEAIGVRRDSKWTVPEPELALVINSRGKVTGCTIGNDVSARDIEGANLLYLPQAKVYDRSCALGPCVVLGASEAAVRTWTIRLEIHRAGHLAFSGQTDVGRIKRRFDELAQFLFRSQTFPQGAVLLTGTGVVPPDDFTLEAGDTVRITVSGIGTLENPVVAV
jgi:2-dehydro-3-deoxy-D-arabinonate dehydratase